MKILESRYLRAAAVAAAASLPLAFQAGEAAAAKVDGPKVEWNFAMWGSSRALSINIEELARMVSEATDGKFTIKIHWGAALAPEKEQIDGLKIGAYESTLAVVDYSPGKSPGWGGPSLPFLPVPNEHISSAVRFAYFSHPGVQRDMKAWDSVFAMPVLVPSYEYMGTGEPPKGVESYKGMRVRAIGGLGDAMRSLGAAPVSFVSTEVYNAMERGILDAAAFGYYAHKAYKLYTISKWYTKGMDMGRPSGYVAHGQKAYDALPPQYRKLLDDSARPATKIQADKYQEIEDEAEALFKKAGLTLVEVGPELREEFIKIGARPVWDAWVKEVTEKGYPGQELLDLILKTAKAGQS